MSHDDFFAELGIQREDATSGEAKPKARKERRREKVERKRRKRRRHWLTTVVLVIVLAAVGVVGYKAVGIMRGVSGIGTSVEDYEGTGDKSIVVTVPEGATGRIIGEILKEKGVVASVEAFVEAYNANTKAGTIQAGTYSLKTRMSAANAVAALLDPRNKDGHALTVPEGFTKAQIKDRLMSVGGFSAEEVDAAYADTAAIGLPEAAGGNVEGWLAASTYDIPDGATATDVVAQMVAATVKTLTTLGVEPDNYQRVLIKASIVEREVASPEYYGQVARVIENRLIDTEGETRGLLQMDSTVQYGLGRVGGIPSKEEIADGSNAYNTYQHAGLPPTPIGSPGTEVIKAVLNPPQGEWLYFVTVNLETGETLFATTHEEQDANTTKLREYCEKNKKVCEGESGGATPGSESSAAPSAAPTP